jgi:hypothetical protein
LLILACAPVFDSPSDIIRRWTALTHRSSNVTLRGALLATLWAGVCITAWIQEYKLDFDRSFLLSIALLAFRIIPAFACLGALTGRSWKMTQLGLLAWALVVLSMMLSPGAIHS